MPVLTQQELPLSNIARELVGADHDVDVCIIFVDAPPGRGPSLHRHPYAEVFIVQEGRGTFVLGDQERELSAGEIAIAPAGIDIHLSRSFDTEWL